MNKIDNYSSFNYKNESYSTTAYSLSVDFNGFIINEGVDLTFFNASSFSHEFMTPQFANQSYFMGTTQENREFTFPILLKAVTMAKYKNFLRWLNPKDEGILWFDYNPYWGYDVKVNSISEGKFTVNQDCTNELTYNIELTVGFITKNDWAARWIGAAPVYNLLNNLDPSNQIIDNEENLPFINSLGILIWIDLTPDGPTLDGNLYDYTSTYSSNIDDPYINPINPSKLIVNATGGSVTAQVIATLYRITLNTAGYKFYLAVYQFTLNNNHNIFNYYKFNYNIIATGGCSFSINVDDIDIYKIEFSGNEETFSGTIYTQYGIAIDNNGSFKNMKISNILYLRPKESKTFYITIDGNITLNSFTIEPDSREII